MSNKQNSTELDLLRLEARTELDYDESVDLLCKIESQPNDEKSALSVVNLVIRILASWPLDNRIERKSLRLLCRYSDVCAAVREHAIPWADHPEGSRRLWAASILPAIEPDHPKVIEWLERPELNVLPIEKAWQVDSHRDRVVAALLQAWPKSKCMKGRLLEFCRREQDVYLAAEILCLEPTCPQSAEVYLECIGTQDPYNEMAHEVMGASYSYLRTTWPASRLHDQVTAALQKQFSLTTERLKTWITLDEHGRYLANQRQLIAACRILGELGNCDELIATALGTLLTDPSKCRGGSYDANFCELASLELLAAMGPRAVAALPYLTRFASSGWSYIFAEYIFTTLISIGSRSTLSLATILAVLKLDPPRELELQAAKSTRMYEHAGRALAILFQADNRIAGLLDKACFDPKNRSQFVHALENTDLDSIPTQVDLFIAHAPSPSTDE